MKKVITPLAALIVSSFAMNSAHAAVKLDYFVGADLGLRLSGGMMLKNTITDHESDNDLDNSAIYGIHGGVTLNDHHRITLGYTHEELSLKDDSESTGLDTVKAKYDYVFNLTNNINLTAGANLGYEMAEDNSNLDGMVYGIQTGVEYNLNHWSFGGELGYTLHNAEDDSTMAIFKASLQDEATLMTNVTYHF
ncbi:outer membrane beta-barrel protein [Photobacterium leiognathi]|uniref:outer membrane beta-barrel protein n=1 Tax=Photobacterium leiognathi TaxID=553611 RepID=UPI002981821B|nr:outer membrane beta-barrel protein [Photobacterium leiognathi]